MLLARPGLLFIWKLYTMVEKGGFEVLKVCNFPNDVFHDFKKTK